MADYLIKDTTLTGIADAIRGKTGGTDPIMVSDMANQISGISGGGGGGSGGGDLGSGAHHVVVIDYDGTILAEKYLDDGEVFTLPDAPSHKGLVFDGWTSPVTMTNNTVTVSKGDIIVGPMYHTASGATEIDIFLTKVTGLTFTFADVLTEMTSIDWGDGTTDSTLTHTYSDYGEYTIKIYGVTKFATSSSVSVVSQSPSEIKYAIREIRFGPDLEAIGSYAFQYCYSLESVVIPNSVSYVYSGAFQYCYSLESVVIPNSVSYVSEFAFKYCYILESVVLSPTISYLGAESFSGCYALKNIIIPASVATFYAGTFMNCRNLLKYDFTSFTSVPQMDHSQNISGISALCQILVPSNLYNDWVKAAYWSNYANYITAV